MKTCVVHEIALERGGGVTVAEELAKATEADLFIGYAPSDVVEKIDLNVSLLYGDYVPQIFNNANLRRLFYAKNARSIPEIKGYDVVIQSGSLLQWYNPPTHQRLIRYYHSPGYPFHLNSRNLYQKFYAWIKSPTFNYPDASFANSDLTKKEVEKRTNGDVDVLYPPVDVDKYRNGKSEYFVTITRLTEGKNVKNLVQKFGDIEDSLKVIGTGPLENELRQKSPSNVEITGWVNEKEKINLLADAKAFINHSGNESFGISTVEGMASGIPVLCKEGGFVTIEENTGIVYEDLQEGIAVYRDSEWDHNRIMSYAKEEYGKARFQETVIDVLK